MKRLLSLVFGAFVLVACAEPAPAPVTPRAAPPAEAPPLALSSASSWAGDTHSPRPTDVKPTDAIAREVLDACGRADEVLMRLAASHPEDLVPPLREAGSPYMHVSYMGAANVDGDPKVLPQLKAMLKLRHTGYTRCGVAKTGADVHVLRTEAFAELGPLPVSSRTGSWLNFDATVYAPVTSPKIVVVGPRGAPKTFPTSLDAQLHTHARFVLDHPGAFTVQLIADVEDDGFGRHQGNQVLLEAQVFADVDPSHTIEAPGEKEPSLEAMVTAVRKSEGLAPLQRDPRLDMLATAHVAKMVKAGKVWHDVGDGDFARRFQAAGFAASVVGENVARADSLPLAHRALWQSPSHRLNLLHAKYTRFGLATVTQGSQTWVCETFSSEFQ